MQGIRRAWVARWLWALVDAAVWVVAVYAATWFRFDFRLDDVRGRITLAFALAAALLHVGMGALVGPYAIGHQRGSFEETVDVARAALATTAVTTLSTWLIQPTGFPRSVPVVSGAVAITGMFAIRFLLRSWRYQNRGARDGVTRVVIFGAGEAGRQLVRTMTQDPASAFYPVALLDDDHSKTRLRIEGVRVRGDRSRLQEVAAAHAAETLVIAMPSAKAALIRDLADRAEEAGLEVLVLPPLSQIINARPTEHDLRSVNLHDLLGRRPVELDMAAIADQIAGRTVLVTGAGGSIGSELCRQIAKFGPERLFLLDRDESGLQATQLSLSGHGLLDTDDLILANIRDDAALEEAFARTRPDIVFHAAALKHLPLLEQYPLEAWKTNVVGTLNVLRAAAKVGVGTFVNISTDKAANPTCSLGYSKRVTERLTADFAQNYPGRYVSVRFGNVLGSRGSVVHAFTAQIEQGGPVTVTHPDVERFFMLIPEACQLVLQAASIGEDGEVLVLEMGEQVKIVEVAKTLIRLSGRKDIEVVFTGLRHGEKLREELFSDVEGIGRVTTHPLVAHVDVPPLDAEVVETNPLVSHAEAREWMRMHCAGVEPSRA
ncbi:SDR family NAD(P)-dependent oxidoreductase [Oryzihumus sp.]